jgi:hypothetical protein
MYDSSLIHPASINIPNYSISNYNIIIIILIILLLINQFYLFVKKL